MTKDFSNPRKLGFMRLVQVLFAINIVMSITFLAFLAEDSFSQGFPDILDFLNLIFDGVAFWLIWQRKSAARMFVIGFCIFNIIIGAAYNIATDSFSVSYQVFLSCRDIILIAYFLNSRRVKAVLIQPFSMEKEKEQIDEDIARFQPGRWSFWRNLIIYFCFFSVAGHWMEAAYCTLIRFGFIPGTYDPDSLIWQSWLYPFLVYGFGAVACVLILFPVKVFLQKRIGGVVIPLLVSFVVSALVCTLIELVMGLVLNQPLPDGSLPLWDYRDMFCNFMGQVCLQNAVAFGLVATLMTWVIYPGLERLLGGLSKDTMNIVFIAVVIGFLILFFLYCVSVLIPQDSLQLDDSESVSALVSPAVAAGSF